MSLENKFDNLKEYLKELKSIAVAFSSGVDSTFLLKTAKEILKENVIAITVSSNLFPKRELNEAIEFCEKENIKHIIIENDALNIKDFSQNPPNRCYICKKNIFEEIKQIAKDNNIEYVVEGSNTDDDGDYRPGHQAIKELGIISPLKKAQLSKDEIRTLSQKFKLNT